MLCKQPSDECAAAQLAAAAGVHMPAQVCAQDPCRCVSAGVVLKVMVLTAMAGTGYLKLLCCVVLVVAGVTHQPQCIQCSAGGE